MPSHVQHEPLPLPLIRVDLWWHVHEQHRKQFARHRTPARVVRRQVAPPHDVQRPEEDLVAAERGMGRS